MPKKKEPAPQRVMLGGKLPVDENGNLVVGRGSSPMDALIDAADLRCTICNAKRGQCDCWTKCPVPGCSWSYEKGTNCDNPAHAKRSR